MATNIPFHGPATGQITVNTHTGSQQVYNGANWVNIAPTPPAPSMSYGANYGLTFHDGDRTITVKELIDFMEIMKQRLCILEPAMEQHEHFPALKAAYEHYKLIERMCLGDKENNE